MTRPTSTSTERPGAAPSTSPPTPVSLGLDPRRYGAALRHPDMRRALATGVLVTTVGPERRRLFEAYTRWAARSRRPAVVVRFTASLVVLSVDGLGAGLVLDRFGARSLRRLAPPSIRTTIREGNTAAVLRLPRDRETSVRAVVRDFAAGFGFRRPEAAP